MHRKSMEAAEQLKAVEDGETQETHDKGSGHHSDTSDEPNKTHQPHHHHQNLSEQQHESQCMANMMSEAQDFRTNSIAALRAKAQEHCARILSNCVAIHDVSRDSSSPSTSHSVDSLSHSDPVY